VNVEVLPSGWTGKKNALKVGIDHAKHDFLLFTDADCEVESQWISGMRNAFSNGADLVLGVAPLRTHGGILGLLQQYETLTTALQYTGAAGWGMPYMGVGRSIGYTKGLYNQIDGFKIHQNRLSGDDDLLVNQAQNLAKTAVVHRKGSWAWSVAPRTWMEWFRQKMRHHSAASAYSVASKLILGCLHGGTALFYLSLGWALTTQGNPALALAIWGCFSVLQASFLLAFPWPNRKSLLWCLPLLDVLLVLYLSTIGAVGLVRKPRWN
jgi:cellulose synthase/poly-beta-1,6-N-acetylglucosamine synthase-like glycosyltransferase